MTVGGHFERVEDIDWDPESGEFLLSVSADQTTRLHGYWRTDDEQEVLYYIRHMVKICVRMRPFWKDSLCYG